MNGSGIPARHYGVVVDHGGDVRLEIVEDVLRDVDIRDGCLSGPHVRVTTRAVLVDDLGDHGLHGRAVDPIALRDGTLCFDPAKGGARARENRRARGAFNAIVAEANRFGMVNAYAHADRAMQWANRLLDAVGAPPLPPLGVVVGAHSGSRLPGYAHGDGDLRTGELRPLSGGHYRLSQRTTIVPEPVAVAPTGEIHLGPSRYRKPFAGWTSYLRNAAHNPAIVYHEFGHHLCRHTADFRVNARRRPDAQRNGKTGVEEGICDYVAAVLLGTARPYGWYRADRGRRRDLHALRSAAEIVDPTDAHHAGAAWAPALWRCRERLVDERLLDTPGDHDRVVVATLLRVGRIGTASRGRAGRRAEARRCDPATMAETYFAALGDEAGPRAVDVAAEIFDTAALVKARALVAKTASPC